jgi:transposase-like protein
MDKRYKRAMARVKLRKSQESVKREAKELEVSFLKEDLVRELHESVHNFALRMGLLTGLELIESEVRELCGGRYERGKGASRYGSQPGYLIVGGQKLAIERPRVRGVKEVKLATYKALQRKDALNEAVLARMLRGVSTRQYEGAIESTEHTFGVRRSSVSRHFQKATKVVIEGFTKRRFDRARYPVIFIDGIEYGGEMLVVGLGVTSDGCKEILGIRQGASENKAVVVEVLEDLVARGLSTTQATLFVIDGGRALVSGIKSVFGKYAVIQRCQVHKRRNIQAHVPEKHWPEVKSRLDRAYGCQTYDKALSSLTTTAKWLQRIAPDAADSLSEGMEDTLTVHKLNVPALLRRSISSTNVIESALSAARRTTRRVTRWRDGDMRKRWCLSGLLQAEEKFQKLQGAGAMRELIAALDQFVGAKQIDSLEKAA